MEEHSFDALAKEMADGAISRGRALKYFGAAILGATLGGGMLGIPIAEAKKKKKKKKKKKRHTNINTCLPADAPCQDSSQCCPSTTSRTCDVPVNASNSDKTCCGGAGAKCGPKNGDGDDTAPFCCAGFTCTNGSCQPVPDE